MEPTTEHPHARLSPSLACAVAVDEDAFRPRTITLRLDDSAGRLVARFQQHYARRDGREYTAQEAVKMLLEEIAAAPVELFHVEPAAPPAVEGSLAQLVLEEREAAEREGPVDLPSVFDGPEPEAPAAAPKAAKKASKK